VIERGEADCEGSAAKIADDRPGREASRYLWPYPLTHRAQTDAFERHWHYPLLADTMRLW